MKKTVKTFTILFLFLLVLPSLAAIVITYLWNCIIPTVCGFTAISFWQALGMFFLGQILTGGAITALLIGLGGLHAFAHHRDDWHSKWHNMSDEQRRKFFEHRRREHDGFRKHVKNDDGSEK